MKVSRYTPSLLAPEDLEAIFVQRHKLANRLVEQIRASVLTDSKQFNLLIGPRGIGKTHLISMLYHRVAQQEDLKSHLVIAWLREEEWGIGSFFDLVLRILNALQAEYQDDDLASKISSFYDISPKEVEQVTLATLKTFIGKRTLLLLMENLEDVFAGLGDIGQKQLRSFLQEQGCCTIVATSQSLFNGVKLQTSPFYGFFRIQYLKDFAVDEAVSLLTKIAQQEEDSELVDFLQTPKGRSRVQAVHHLAGGNPRIYVVFSEFLTHESLDDLVQPFMNMLDDLTPYYQARMMYLSPQQRKIIEVLSRRKYAMPVKEIAQRCFVTHQTVSNQLKDLRDKGYVLADSIGRQSFYELREPLMRICLSVKETRGEPIRLFVDFLKAWYPRSELQGIQQRLDKEHIREAEEPSRLTGNGYQQSVRANSKHSSSIANDVYLALALVEQEEEELDPKIAACVQERNQQYEQQNFKEALTIAKKLVQIRGRDVDHHWLGNIQSDLGRYEEAITSYDKAIEIKPDKDQAWYNRGVTLGDLGRYEEAIASYDKAIEIKPDKDQAWYNRGVTLGDLGRYEEAITSFDKVLEFKPDDDQAWYNRGVALRSLGRYEEAITSFDKAIEFKPDKDQAWNNRGVALGDLGRYEEAIASYDKALEIKPDDDQAWYNRGVTLGDLGRYEEAIASYDKALEIKPDKDQAWYNRGVALGDLGRYEEAIASYDKVLEFKPDDDQAWYNRGVALRSLGRYEEAITSFDKAIEFKPDKDQAWNNRGVALGDLGRYEEAIASYDKALEIKPDDDQAWYNRGVALGDLGRYEEAITSFDKAIEFKPDKDQAWYNRGVALGDLGRYEEAITSFDKAIEFKPDKDEAWYNRGVALGYLGRYEEAITSFDKALKLTPDDDQLWILRSTLLGYIGQYEEAVISAEKSLKINPKQPFGLLNRAELVLASNPNDAAYQTLENALDQLTEAEKAEDWRADIMLRSLFKQNQDTQQWQFHIQKLIPLFTEYQFLNALGVGLIKSCDALISEMVSQNAAQAWLEVWTDEAEEYEEFKIPLRLLKAAVHYKEVPDDPRVFPPTPTEERTILKQALGLETE